MLKEKVKAYPDKQGISIRGSEWSLWFQKVKTKDDRDMFLVKPLRCVFDNADQRFGYREMAQPLWLTPVEIGDFMKALAEL